MLDIGFIRENRDLVIERLKIRNLDVREQVDELLACDKEWRGMKNKAESLQAEGNQLAKQIGTLYKQGDKDGAETIKARTSEIKTEVKETQEALKNLSERRTEILNELPNLPHPSVPAGKDSEDNALVLESGDKPNADYLVPHWELIDRFGIIDFELGVKLTGSGFPVYKGKGAQLQRALVNFFLDEARSAGFLEIQPPLMVNAESAYATGQLPDKEGQMYHTDVDGFYLIPTAEVPVTNLFRDTILEADDLPVKCCGYTPCFRREAGAWGSHVRGLNRLHQFDKVEIVQIAHPDRSYEILDEMVTHVKTLVEKLEIPFRIVRLCGGDLGFTSALTFDLEVWAGGQKRWLEASSISNFEAFQSKRLQLRFRKGNDKPQLTHTLNGSALALPRIVAALLENNFNGDSIRIPDVLVKYTGFDSIK